MDGCFLSHITPPNYYYVNENSVLRKTRQKYQKHKLKELFPDTYDPTLSESEIILRNNYYRLYDYGNLVYVYNNSEKITKK